jgi:hypothetical protein
MPGIARIKNFMMIALIAKDLGSVAREHVFHFILMGFLTVYLVASLFFIDNFLTADSYPFEATASLLFYKISFLQGALLTLLTPWVALRIQDRDLSGASEPAVTDMLATPLQIILSKLVVSTLCLLNLVILTLPVFCLVRLLGATNFHQIGWLLLETFIFLMLLAVLILHWRLRFRSWLSSWVFSYIILAALGVLWHKIWISEGHESCAVLFSSLLLLAIILLFPHGNRMLLYKRN